MCVYMCTRLCHLPRGQCILEGDRSEAEGPLHKPTATQQAASRQLGLDPEGRRPRFRRELTSCVMGHTNMGSGTGPLAAGAMGVGPAPAAPAAAPPLIPAPPV